jgi:hypothetical protein
MKTRSDRFDKRGERTADFRRPLEERRSDAATSHSLDCPSASTNLAPGQYWIGVHNEQDFWIGGGNLWVGVDPEWSAGLEWALDDPLIAQLPGEAVIVGAFPSVNAAQLRAGVYPEGAENFMMHPELLDELRLGTMGYSEQESITTSVTAPATQAVPATTTPTATNSLEPPLPLASPATTAESNFDWMSGLAAALTSLALTGLGRRLFGRHRRPAKESAERVLTRS